MPDTFANPYADFSPIGSALKNLSGVLSKPKDEATAIHHAEAALKLKQQRENTAALGDTFRTYGTDAFDRQRAAQLAINAGYAPENLAINERYLASNNYGATDPRATNAFVGAGGAYGSTAAGFREGEAGTQRRADQTLAENQRQFDNMPTVVGGDQGPVFATRAGAIGQPAVEDLGKVKGNAARIALNAPGGLASADPTTQRFIGADERAPAAPKNYVKDGVNYITNDGLTDARSGEALPPGGALAAVQGPAKDVGLTNSVTTDLQKNNIAGQRVKSLLGFTRNLAHADANNFGVSGMVKGAVQDVNAVAGNVAQGLGYTGIQEAVNNARQKALDSGVSPGLLSGVFDPKLPALHTAADLLVFSAAEALAGQSGRSMTDKDVKLFKGIVGDPQEWAGNQQKYLSKLDTIEQILDNYQGITDQNLRGGKPENRPAAPAAPGANVPPTQAPGVTAAPDPLAQARDAIARGADPNAVRQRLQQGGIDPSGL